MTDELFQPPASSAGIEFGDHLGHLLLITPTALEVGVKTQFGENDAIRATLVDLDIVDPTTGLPLVLEDVLIFPRVLISQLRSRIGGRVLGRLGQNPPKPGQSAAWSLVDFTTEDAQRASGYITHMASRSFSAPAADPWAATPAPAAAPTAPPTPTVPAAGGWGGSGNPGAAAVGGGGGSGSGGWGTGAPPF